MTLNTSIAVKPTAVDPLFDFCRDLIGTPPHIKPIREPSSYRKGVMDLLNPGGIGLPAWLWLHYGADGPLLTEPSASEDEDERAWRGSDPTQNGWAAIEVTFDTAYGYTGPNGGGCGDLHAWLVREVGLWLDERNVDWQWQNEFTGEWFRRHDGLADLGDAERGALR